MSECRWNSSINVIIMLMKIRKGKSMVQQENKIGDRKSIADLFTEIILDCQITEVVYV